MIMTIPEKLIKTEFQYGRTTVRIVEGDILNPLTTVRTVEGNTVDPRTEVDLLVSSDDNYLTMRGGVARGLAELAGASYRTEAQAQCPIKAGTVVVTRAYAGQKERWPQAQSVLHAAVIDYDAND